MVACHSARRRRSHIAVSEAEKAPYMSGRCTSSRLKDTEGELLRRGRISDGGETKSLEVIIWGKKGELVESSCGGGRGGSTSLGEKVSEAKGGRMQSFEEVSSLGEGQERIKDVLCQPGAKEKERLTE